MITLDELKSWLMQQPRPAFARITTADGAVHDVQCTGTTWPKITETVAALQPELLQAMTADGKLLRALRPADRSEDWGERPAAERNPPLANIPITAADPETQRFALVAQLIAEAYRHSNENAFSRLAQIVDSLVSRSGDVERAREQMYRAHVKQLEEQIKSLGAEPQEGGDLLQTMLGQFLGGMAASSAPIPPHVNGKGKA